LNPKRRANMIGGVLAQNPYKPPTAPVRDTGPPAPRPLTLALFAGLGVGIGGMLLSRAIQALVYITLIEPDGAPRQAVESMSAWLFTLVGSSCIFSVLGGYVCARLARRHERRLTLVLAVLSTAIAYSTFGANGPLVALVLTLTCASVMTGGLFGRYRNVAQRRRTAAAMAA
jgi:hypothetical protein